MSVRRAGQAPIARGLGLVLAWGILVAALTLPGGCAGVPTASGPGATAKLIVRCPIADATVWIDDRLAGQIAEVRGGIRLGAGDHRVEVRHDAYHSRYFEISLAPGAIRTLEVALVENLD